MNNDFESKRKRIAVVLAVVAGLIIVIMGAIFLGNKNKDNDGTNATTDNTPNYVATDDGTKVNTSEQVAEDKKVENILLEKSKIVYVNGTSQLTSKVTNDSAAKDNLRFTVKFIANDGSVIAESIGYVGSIKANETKYIDSYITADVTNAKNITYEIIK